MCIDINVPHNGDWLHFATLSAPAAGRDGEPLFVFPVSVDAVVT